jgi:thiamine pyrophosphokinase
MTQPPILPHKGFFNVKTAALIANGAIHNYPQMRSLIMQYQKRIAVDGGLLHCRAMGIIPDLIVGDLDSVPEGLTKEYPDTPIIIFPSDKNYTDMELAIAAVNTPSLVKIGVFGGLERQTDHSLANLHIACRYPGKIFFETERETAFAIKGSQMLDCLPGQKISLIPLGAPAHGVTTRGLNWELSEATLDRDFMSISNVCLGNSVAISVDGGIVICCMLRP